MIFRTRDAIFCRHFWQYPLLFVLLHSRVCWSREGSADLLTQAKISGEGLLVSPEPEAKQSEGRKNKQLVIPFD